MFQVLAATDPQTTLASGNILAILALIIVTMAGVIIYLAKKLFDQQRDSAAEVRRLNDLLLSESKAHTLDYREMSANDQAVIGNTSQTLAVFGEKIEVAKGRR